MDYWARRARGRGNFQRGRGRFPFKKSGSSPKWTHDKFQGDGLIEDEDEVLEDRHKEEKVGYHGVVCLLFFKDSFLEILNFYRTQQNDLCKSQHNQNN